MTSDSLTGPDINVLVLCKGAERYVLLYPDARADEATRQCRYWATNADLNFSWYDAEVLSGRIRAAMQP